MPVEREADAAGAFSAVELAIETNTTGACWPWNLSTVPTATSSGRRERSIRTWALYGATTRTSRPDSGRVSPCSSVNGVPSSPAIAAAIASASSSEDWPCPSCSTGIHAGPFPAASERRAVTGA